MGYGKRTYKLKCECVRKKCNCAAFITLLLFSFIIFNGKEHILAIFYYFPSPQQTGVSFPYAFFSICDIFAIFIIFNLFTFLMQRIAID